MPGLAAVFYGRDAHLARQGEVEMGAVFPLENRVFPRNSTRFLDISMISLIMALVVLLTTVD
jgi:hypothetical protein